MRREPLSGEEMSIRCPECGTEQSSDAPFCENCGFRLRSRETEVEGLPQITPEMLRASVRGPARPEVVATEETEALGDDHRPGGAREETAPEGHPAVDGHTLMEGVPAIKADTSRATSQEPTYAAPEEARAPADASTSYLGIAPPGAASKGPSLVAFGLVWSVITAAGVLVAWATLGRADEPAPAAAAAEQARVELPAGPFKRGLDTRTRARILRTCMNAAEDPATECEEATLLAGEYPQEDVTLEAFSIDKLEVSVAEYAACVAAGTCAEPDYKGCKVYTHQGLQVSLRVPKALKEPGHPQVCVTRDEAAAYCAHAGGALPSHDQWERAARGDAAFLFPWDNTWAPDRANWGEADVTRTHVVGQLDGHAWTAPVGSYPDGASEAGVLDLAGNAAEWIGTDADPGHVRGGSWTSDPFSMRTTARESVPPTQRRTDVGFRCAY
jgi:formylglycine-generating enzyme required for sulfatase activity